MICKRCRGKGQYLTPRPSFLVVCTACGGTGQEDCCSGEVCEPTKKQLHMTEIVEDMDAENGS